MDTAGTHPTEGGQPVAMAGTEPAEGGYLPDTAEGVPSEWSARLRTSPAEGSVAAGACRRGGRRPASVWSMSRALVVALTCSLLATSVGRAQGRRPFDLPFREPPGLGTWYISHLYGNTIFAYYERRDMYRSGQGMHMGLDFATPCGTSVRAIGDGVVRSVDGPGGAGPHNLMLDHGNGYVSFYGHLLERPSVAVGQVVSAGDIIGLSGDMLGTCVDSPHLHLEIRDAGTRVFYNPITLIEADWHSLLLLGPGTPVFAIDLDHPRRWRSIDDQPTLRLGGPLLNDYASSWPNNDR